MRRFITLGVVLGAAMAMLSAGSAQAAATWTANPGASYSNGTVTLDSSAGPTSYETNDLGVEIAPNDTISFDFTGPCAAGAPRLYFVVDGTAYNTWDGQSGGCGELNQGFEDGTVLYTYTGAAGTITDAFLVNDTGTPSVITISNLVIGGQQVALGEDPPAPTKDDCKNGGWEEMGFRNQGQCVSSFAKAK